MSKERDEFVSAKVAKMTLGEKCGQLLTFTWRGAYLTPSGFEQITRLHAGGLCLEPYALETCKNLYWGRSQIDPNFKKPKDYFDIAHTYFSDRNFGVSVTPAELTDALNALQKIAMGRSSGIPLHITIDMEGDFKNDYSSGHVVQFPPPMGIAAIDDLDLAYKVANTLGKQMALIGITQFYHPVCDVNINPLNPEIGVRSFGDDPQKCAKFVAATVRGYQDAGIVATIKHFAGRGDSSTDAHETLDVCRGDMKRMRDVELVTFQAGVDAGAKALMTAHTIFPAFDKEYPATLSSKILTDLLRKEMGFQGVVVSDAIGMAAILKKWPLPKACAMAIKAGVDTILLKADDESRSQCYFGIKTAVEKGELSEERLNDAVTRLLRMKYDQGLFDKAGKMDAAKTDANVHSKEVQLFSRQVAEKAQLIVRDDKHLLPLSKDKKILVIEQLIPYSFLGKDLYSHPHMFCEQMAKHSMNLILDDADFHANDDDVAEALQLAKQADLVVMTNYFARIEKRGNNQHMVKALKKAGHTVIVVTNFPYRKGTTKEADAVICNFSGSPDSIRASADLLWGDFKPTKTTKMPIDLSAEANLPDEPVAKKTVKKAASSKKVASGKKVADKKTAAKKPATKKAAAKKPAAKKPAVKKATKKTNMWAGKC
jgi:beta-N-acetylhexosaminidase